MIDIEHERIKLRRAAICKSLYSVWPRPLGVGLIRESLTEDVTGTKEAINRALYYMRDRGVVVQLKGPGAASVGIYRLTAKGVDAVEAAAEFGVERKRRNRMLRLRVLQAMDWGRPHPMSLHLIARALAEESDLDLSEPSLERAIAYLAERHLAEECQGQLVRITADGIDYLSGEGDGIDGVARPADW